MKEDLQFALRLDVQLSSSDELIAHLRYAVEGFAWPAVIGIASPWPKKPKLKPSPDANLHTLLERATQVFSAPHEVEIGFGRLSSLSWGQRPDQQSFHLSLGLSPPAGVFADPADCVRAPTHVARRLLERGVRITGAVERLGDAEACIPFVPLAKTRRPLVVVTPDEVTAAYERPDEFWSAGWTIETFGEQRLITRCQNTVRKGDVLREIQDHQWQMARAAKPKQTKYGSPVVTDEEKPIYEAGEPRLRPVGRQASTGLVEYSCVLEEGEHLHGFEIYYLRSLVQNKRMQDGTPLTSVRVVFLERWMAESEKRPLLDNGVEVHYEDATSGELVQVTT